jgi:hypothetical protein
MIPCSPYLTRKLRTPREACHELAEKHPELPRPDCQTCCLKRLCDNCEQSMRPPGNNLAGREDSVMQELPPPGHRPH